MTNAYIRNRPVPFKRETANWGATRTRILKRDGWRCHYCASALSNHRGHPYDRTKAGVDHKIPLSRGGSYGDENLVACCWTCNMRKGKKDAEAFIWQLSADECEGTRI